MNETIDPVPGANIVPDVAPESPLPDPPVEPAAETEPTPPQKWYRVEFVAPANTDLPMEAAGRSWMERSVHVLPEALARSLDERDNFTLLDETAAPANAADCGC